MIINVKFTEDNSVLDAEIKEAYFAGLKGDDGFSPLVDMSKTGNVTTLKITDVNGEHVTHIYDGGGGGGIPPIDNETLVVDSSGILRVNTTDLAEQDNTQPITSAGTYMIVGNIEVLLKTI